MWKRVIPAFFLLTAVVLLVVYVYPTYPSVVWMLLGISWLCFRLTLRARSLFGEPRRVPVRSRTPDRTDHRPTDSSR